MNDLFSSLQAALSAHPTATVSTLTRSLTFREIQQSAEGREAFFSRALGDSRELVAIRDYNSLEYVIDLIALLGQGSVPVLIDPATSNEELQHLIDGCGIAYDLRPSVGTLERTASALETKRPEGADDTELCRLTSGSTRTPACLEFSGRAIVAAAQSWIAATLLNSDDLIACFAGFYNGLAFNTSLIPGILSGASLAIASTPAHGRLMRRYLVELRPSVLVGFPAAYKLIVDTRAHADLSTGTPRLRLALSSAAPLEGHVAERFRAEFISITDYYGVAEVGPITLPTRHEPVTTQGRPLPGVHLRIDEESRVLVKTESMATKYLNYAGELESRTDTDGFYKTSDRGAINSEGELVLAGRLDDVLQLNGRKFHPNETIVALNSFVSVRASVVVSVRRSDTDILAAVVEGSLPIDVDALRSHCASILPKFMVPSVVVVVPDLPRGGAGKISRAKVMALVEQSIVIQSTK